MGFVRNIALHATVFRLCFTPVILNEVKGLLLLHSGGQFAPKVRMLCSLVSPGRLYWSGQLRQAMP